MRVKTELAAAVVLAAVGVALAVGLLGGVVVEMDGVIIDGSLKKKLAEIKDVMNR